MKTKEELEATIRELEEIKVELKRVNLFLNVSIILKWVLLALALVLVISSIL
jgi:hypothetical protein